VLIYSTGTFRPGKYVTKEGIGKLKVNTLIEACEQDRKGKDKM